MLSGLRQPIVVILLLIAFFSTIAGKPLDGLLMLLVAAGLAWDTGKRSGEAGGESSASKAGLAGERSWAARPAPRGRRAVLAVASLAAAAAVVGSFRRFSWAAPG